MPDSLMSHVMHKIASREYIKATLRFDQTMNKENTDYLLHPQVCLLKVPLQEIISYICVSDKQVGLNFWS